MLPNQHFKSLTTLILFLFVGFSIKAQTIVINEYSCANLDQYADAYDKHEDWIELYNPADLPVDISGYHVSDKKEDPTKWTFPAGTTIKSKGYLRLWASGRNEVSGQHYHTNFKLVQTKKTSEMITLAKPDAVIIDTVEVKKTQKGHSRGRVTDGAAQWGIFMKPTLLKANQGSVVYNSYADRPDFDQVAGQYPGPITVKITNNEPASTIHYTLDGSHPVVSSPIYTEPIEISKTTVLKAIAISDSSNVIPSFIEFSTYLINENHTIPVVSIAGYNLDKLANGNENLKPHGSIEYFNVAGERKARAYGEYNSHGQDSWVNDHRSIDIVVRDEMGYAQHLDEKIFSLTDREEFQRLILRAAGDDNYPGNFLPDHEGCAHVRDAYIQNLVKAGNMHLDVRTATKAIIYLNGVYWGVYDLRELPDDHDFTEYYYNQGKYDLQYVLTWGNTWAEYGGDKAMADWEDLADFVLDNDMTKDANLAKVEAELDIASLIDYVIVNTVTVCSDWLNYNTGWWRGFNPEGEHKKWGYILWDNDATFGYYINYTGVKDTSTEALPCNSELLEFPSKIEIEDSWYYVSDTVEWNGKTYYPGDSIFIKGYEYTVNPDKNDHMAVLNKLRENPKIQQYYLSRYADLMNTVFSCDNMLYQLDSIVAVIEPEMPRQAARWGGSVADWKKNVERLRNFIAKRCNAIYDGMTDCYDLTGPYEVDFNVNPQDVGKIQINSITVDNLPFKAKYFAGLDVNLTAIPNDETAYAFKEWTTTGTGIVTDKNTAATTLQIGGNTGVTAQLSKIVGIEDPAIDSHTFEAIAAPSVTYGPINIRINLPQNAQQLNAVLLNSNGVIMGNLFQTTKTLPQGQYNLALNLQEIPNLTPGMYFIHLNTETGHQKTIMVMLQP
ncbi:MAG: CotH kinase family protein [Sphingobacteriales bacterium]|jgi:hypothetical protein|nr:CotH kinase family protein [Sphingobacteriales bacterium]MBP9141118.1 CotH kinase family protein [Chitinophagales bacterium]MDA0197722.1 CotH kinase family protein [Bacteroidota bacterium]MBK7528673.1 CotH kinase family protein [Sphingobacteriales bacterium]MBK8679363.1 CotH kinase family protein [Sphingobacteriales bacterium]